MENDEPVTASTKRYDDVVYGYTGEMGRYQWLLFSLFCLIGLFSVDATHMVFAGGEMAHWCSAGNPTLFANESVERQKYFTIPRTGPSDTGPYSSCLMFDVDWNSVDAEQLAAWNRSELIANGTAAVACSMWTYDQSQFTSTFVKRFDLVCDRENLLPLISSLFMIGVFVGAFVSGTISDRIGRRWTIHAFSVVVVAASGMSIWPPNYATLAAGRFLLGFSTLGRTLTTFVWTMELAGVRYRAMLGLILMTVWSFGLMLQALLAYYCRDEVSFQLANMAPRAFLQLFLIFLPESPRWLVVRGRYKEAANVLGQICRFNKRELPDNIDLQLSKLEQDTTQKKTFNCKWLFRSPTMAVRTVIMDCSWMTCSLIYYALTLNVGALSGDIYINTFISGAVEVPANLLCSAMIGWRHFGRRLTGCLSLIGAGVFSFLCIPFVIFKYGVAATSMAMVGRLAITMAYSLVYVYAAEIFPTESRNVSIAIASMSARIGSVLAPFTGRPMMRLWEPLPSLVFGVLATTSGISYLFLPETLGKPLPNTAQQAEAMPSGLRCRSLYGKRVAPVQLNGNVGCKSVDRDDRIVTSY